MTYCKNCDSEVKFGVDTVNLDEPNQTKFVLECDCQSVRVWFGNIGVGNLTDDVPSEWKDKPGG